MLLQKKLRLNLTSRYTSSMNVYKRRIGALQYTFKLRAKDGDPIKYVNEYDASVSDNQTSTMKNNSDLILRYNTNITKNITFKGLLGGNSKSYKSDYIGVSRYNLTIPDFFNISVRECELSGSQSTYRHNKLGVYSQLDFGFKNYLHLSMTGRNDWTSTLKKGNNSYFYPVAGLSFVVSDAFLSIKNNKGISYLKTTLNLSKTSSPPPAYKNADVFYLPGNFPYKDTEGLSQSIYIYNSDLRPELTTSLDMGIEYGLLRNSILGSVSAYQTNSVDQIIPINVSPTSGAGKYYTNIGEVITKGVEADLDFYPIKTKNIEWKIAARYTHSTTRVKKLIRGLDEIFLGGLAGDAEVMAKEGEIYPVLKISA